MKQNKYDEAEFFRNYSQMARSTQGLEAAGEWYKLRTMLPELKDKMYWIWAVDLVGTAGTHGSSRPDQLLAWIYLRICCSVHGK